MSIGKWWLGRNCVKTSFQISVTSNQLSNFFLLCHRMLPELFEWNWKFSFAMLPLILLTLAPTPAEARRDFSVYRMHQYDLLKEPYGSRASLVSFEGNFLKFS